MFCPVGDYFRTVMIATNMIVLLHQIQVCLTSSRRGSLIGDAEINSLTLLTTNDDYIRY